MAMLTDGFATTIAFAQAGSIAVYERTVQPPGVQGGGEINISTMGNTAWRTRAPKALKQMDAFSLTVGYDPAVYSTLISSVNVNGLITITFPDTSTLAFYGWIDEFTPGDNAEGEFPEADMSIVPSLQNAGVETAPVYTAPGL